MSDKTPADQTTLVTKQASSADVAGSKSKCKKCKCLLTILALALSVLAILLSGYILFNLNKQVMLGNASGINELNTNLNQQKELFDQEITELKQSFSEIQAVNERIKSRMDNMQPDTEKRKAMHVLNESMDLLNLANVRLTTNHDIDFTKNILHVVDNKLAVLLFNETAALRKELVIFEAKLNAIEKSNPTIKWNKIQTLLGEVTVLKFDTINSKTFTVKNNSLANNSSNSDANAETELHTNNKDVNGKKTIANNNGVNGKKSIANNNESKVNKISKSEGSTLSKQGAINASQKAWQELKSLIKVRHINKDAKMILSTEDLHMLKQQLTFQLDTAAYALVAGKYDYYKSALDNAIKLLESYQLQDNLNLDLLKKKVEALKQDTAELKVPTLDELIKLFKNTLTQFKD